MNILELRQISGQEEGLYKHGSIEESCLPMFDLALKTSPIADTFLPDLTLLIKTRINMDLLRILAMFEYL